MRPRMNLKNSKKKNNLPVGNSADRSILETKEQPEKIEGYRIYPAKKNKQSISE